CALTLLFAALFVHPWAAQAQTSTTGDIAGTVVDQSGAAVAGADVSLTSIDKGTVQHGKTDSQGAYRFALLEPGTYDVHVESQGFQAFTRRVQVALNQITTADVHLSVGPTSETVTVTEAAPLIQAENGNVSTTISEQHVQNMPNPGNDLT